MKEKRMAIVGVGSLGTILGAFLSRAGYHCDLIDTNKAHVDALNKNGAKIIGTVDFTTPVKALLPVDMEGEYDIIFYMTKQTANPFALPQIKQHLAKDGVVVVMQNGIPEEKVAAVVGKERVLGAPIGWAATWIGPGVSSLNSTKAGLSIDLGAFEGPVTPKALEVKKILECMCVVHLTDNLKGNRWTKLLANACVSGLSAVTGGTFGDVMDNEKSLEVLLYIAKEVIDAGRASGVRFEKFYDVHDIGNTFYWRNESEKAAAKKAVLTAFASARKGTASMLQDLEKGQKTEIFAINGHVVDVGKKLGIATPANQFVVDMVTSHEKCISQPDFKWIDLFFNKCK